MSKIVYTDENGCLVVLIPSPNWNGTMEELAKKDVPASFEWRIVEDSKIPASKNYRNAWTDANPTETVDVDLEKAKECQKALMVQKAHERVEADIMGNKDFSIVQAEIEAIDFTAIKDFDTLYNTFPASIDKRGGARKYEMHKEE